MSLWDPQTQQEAFKQTHLTTLTYKKILEMVQQILDVFWGLTNSW